MKTIIALFLLALSASALAQDDSYMVKYNHASHTIMVWTGTGDNLKKDVYLVDAHGYVQGTNKTVKQFIDSVTK